MSTKFISIFTSKAYDFGNNHDKKDREDIDTGFLD